MEIEKPATRGIPLASRALDRYYLMLDSQTLSSSSSVTIETYIGRPKVEGYTLEISLKPHVLLIKYLPNVNSLLCLF